MADYLPEDVNDILGAVQLNRGDIVKVRITQVPKKTSRFDLPTSFATTARFSINGKYVEIRLAYLEPAAGVNDVEIKSDFCCGNEGNETDNDAIISQNVNTGQYLALSLRIEQVIRIFSKGFFYISAIRKIVEDSGKGLENGDAFETASKTTGKTRYVGKNGEYTHFLRRYFTVTPILDPRQKYSYIGTMPIDGMDMQARSEQVWSDAAKEITEIKNHKKQTPLVTGDFLSDSLNSATPAEFSVKMFVELVFEKTCLWRYLIDNHKDEVLVFYKKTQENNPDAATRFFLSELHELLNADNTTSLPSKNQTEELHPPHTAEMAYALHPLYKILQKKLFVRPDFFRWFLEQLNAYRVMSKKDTDRIYPPMKMMWLRFLASLPEGSLSSDDVATLNEWAFYELIPSSVWMQRVCLKCDSLFNWWSHKLLGVESVTISYGFRLRDYIKDHPAPVGYLAYTENYFKVDDGDAIFTPYANKFLAEELKPHEGGEESFSPSYFSAGFHQVAPIIVQMNMMLMNEVLAIENPEVHLHPGLQIKLMEFFIENALIGKYSMIETHSDLMVRRLWRAISEEKIRQSWVSIAFVDAEKISEKDNLWTSRIEKLTLDEHGHISNWPKGFLDDDDQESRALMRAMYGDLLSEMEENDDE